MSSKVVVLSYLQRNKKVIIPQDISECEFDYLRNKVLSLFDFKIGSNVKLDITFQKYDDELNEFIDIETKHECNDTIEHKDKLKVVVTPILQDVDSSTTRVSKIFIICLHLDNYTKYVN